jgi:nitroreductase
VTTATAPTLHPVLAERSSPRSYDPDHTLTDDDLRAVLEAARWAPSSMNRQPWRFVVARRGSRTHEAVMASLAPGNQAWAGRASALVVALAERHRDGHPVATADYDLGLAVAHLTVQAHAQGLHARQMGGFDHGALADLLGVDEHLAPVVVVALGRRDHHERLPGDLRRRETAPRVRRPLSETVLVVDDRSGDEWVAASSATGADAQAPAA